MKLALVSAAIVAVSIPHAFAQQACRQANAAPLTGFVRDSSLASIPGATVVLDSRQTVVSAPDGQFRLDCVAAGRHTLAVTASGFAAATSSITTPHTAQLDLVLNSQRADADHLRRSTPVAGR